MRAPTVQYIQVRNKIKNLATYRDGVSIEDDSKVSDVYRSDSCFSERVETSDAILQEQYLLSREKRREREVRGSIGGVLGGVLVGIGREGGREGGR